MFLLNLEAFGEQARFVQPLTYKGNEAFFLSLHLKKKKKENENKSS